MKSANKANYPSELPGIIHLRLKEKNLQDIARTLFELKKIRGCATYADTVEVIIKESSEPGNRFELKAMLQAEREKVKRLQAKITDLNRAWNALRV